jgi:hypothetical protein
MNTSQAREYFSFIGLTYDCLNEYSLDLLSSFIQDEIMKQRKELSNTALLRMEPIKTTAKQRKTKNFSGVGLTVQGVYFSRREAITFNEDGFIGLCGWASGYHQEPFITGFVRWCDEIRVEQCKNI